MKIFSTILSGIFSAPFTLGWFAIMAVVFDVIYDKVIAPIAGLYGHSIPDVPFWQWIVCGMLCNFITFIFRGTSDKTFTPDEAWGLLGKRLAMGICFIVMAYIINWIWL